MSINQLAFQNLVKRFRICALQNLNQDDLIVALSTKSSKYCTYTNIYFRVFGAKENPLLINKGHVKTKKSFDITGETQKFNATFGMNNPTHTVRIPNLVHTSCITGANAWKDVSVAHLLAPNSSEIEALLALDLFTHMKNPKRSKSKYTKSKHNPFKGKKSKKPTSKNPWRSKKVSSKKAKSKLRPSNE